MTRLPGDASAPRLRLPRRLKARVRGSRLVPTLALAFVTALWGSTFFLSKEVVDRHDPLPMLTVRFALAALVMWLMRPRALIGLPRSTWVHAAILGGIYGLAQIPQYIGLQHTTASESGFLIGTYVVLTPLLNLVLFRVRSSWITCIGVLLAALGLAVLSGGRLDLGLGQLLSLGAAALYALQIVSLSRWSTAGQAWALTTIQMLAISVVVAVPTSFRGFDLSYSVYDWSVVLYLALVASALAIGVQTWAQSRIAASQAAVIMAAEPLWAAGLAVTFTSEVITRTLLAGGALLFLANVLIARSAATRRPPDVPTETVPETHAVPERC